MKAGTRKLLDHNVEVELFKTIQQKIKLISIYLMIHHRNT